MRRLNVGLKIAGGFIALVFVLLVTGGTSYWIIDSLSRALSSITGPVRDAMATTEAGIRSVRKQLIAVDAILLGGISEQTHLLALNAVIEAARAGGREPEPDNPHHRCHLATQPRDRHRHRRAASDRGGCQSKHRQYQTGGDADQRQATAPLFGVLTDVMVRRDFSAENGA